MRIVSFCYSNQRSASVRYRVLIPLAQLRSQNKAKTYLIYPGYTPKKILKFAWALYQCLFLLCAKDAVLLHKIYSNGIYQRFLMLMLRFTQARIIYDIDDAEWWRSDVNGMHQLIRCCDQLHVGSVSLREYFSYLNKPVYVLTSCVNTSSHLAEPTLETFKMGWIGGYNSQEQATPFAHKRAILEMLLPALSELTFPIELILLGVERSADRLELQELQKDKYPHVQMTILNVTSWEQEEIINQVISQWDLGIALMIDHPFNHAKSAFKAKQYMNCGVPVLGNAIGSNDHFITPGATGYLVNQPADIKAAVQTHRNLSLTQRQAMRDHCILHSKAFQMVTYCRQLLEACI
jgi:glycosyltransferase involved in cell wall biosynthesis